MAIIDSLGEFSDAQAVTSSAASTNVIDLGSDRDIGVGRPMYVVLTVDTAISGSSPTVDVDLETDDNESFSSATTIGSFTQMNDTNGTAGATFFISVPSGNERYLRLNYTAGGTVSAGAVNAWLSDCQPTVNRSYPDALQKLY